MIARKLAEKRGVSTDVSMIDDIIDVISEELRKGNTVHLKTFGRFYPFQGGLKKVNLKGSKLILPNPTVKFKPAKTLADKLRF